MCRLSLLLLIVSIATGCATNRDIAVLHNLPLPSSDTSDCCWQLLQSLNITDQESENALDESSLELQAVVLHQANELKLILIDPIGRRVATIIDKGGDISLNKNTAIKTDIPPRFLMATIYLTYWPEQSWKQSLRNTPWQMRENYNQSNGQLNRVIGHLGKDIIRVNNVQTKGPMLNQKTTLRHLLLPLTVTIKTHQRQNLQAAKP